MRVLSRVVAAYGILSAFAVGKASPETCDPRSLDVPNKSFLRLSDPAKPWRPALNNAYVWVDNIDSRFFGGHKPFAVYVLVGKIYPPFSSDRGRLTREGFLRFSDPKDVNNTRFGPFTVPDKWKDDPVFEFTVGRDRFSLHVVRVRTQFGGDNERLELKLCIPLSTRGPAAP
jgi:hypothetical protein